jgi:RNA polymerase sigma-70 factor, ECF subfamily
VLAAAHAGEAWAAEVLFKDLQPRLLRFLRATEPRAADDLSGEVWLAIARGLRSFEGDLAAFRSWVFTIARNRVADHRRTAARRATDPVDFTSADLAVPVSEATEHLVLQQLSAQEAADLVTALLPPDQAEVLLMRVLGDLDVAHVAQVMDRPANWVRVTQHRGLRRLAEHFREIPAEPVMQETAPTICSA